MTITIKMKKTGALLIAVFLFTASFAQSSIKDYVQQTAVAISAISPDSANYADLEAIGKAIGDAKIVMLGEQEHLDAATYTAKMRLVQYLHEMKGFNVLAFESDFFGLNRGWDLLPKDSASIADLLEYNIFSVWPNCAACFPLFKKYIPGTFRTASPLQVTGFDPQMMLAYSRKLTGQLDSVLRALQLPITATTEYRQTIIPLIDSLKYWYYYKPADSSYGQCTAYLQRIRTEAMQKLNKDDYWIQVVDNLLIETEHYLYLKHKEQRRDPDNSRDIQMAANLAWLNRVKYPNEKIIVWAASQHIAKMREGLPVNNRKLITMGGAFTADTALAAQTYVLGFTGYKGTAGFNKPVYSIRQPKKESLENWVRPLGAYAFVDFKPWQRAHPGKQVLFNMSGLNHFNFESNWTDVFDGVFYIEQMYICGKTPEKP